MIGLRIYLAPKDFSRTSELLALIKGAFAYMRGAVDPPSSAERLTLASLADKIRDEHLILAEATGSLAGCAFAAARGDHLYLGKIAVSSAYQGRGIGRAMLTTAVDVARSARLPELRLETRVELTANHRTFEAWGFTRLAETAHPGFTRPTSYTYGKRI